MATTATKKLKKKTQEDESISTETNIENSEKARTKSLKKKVLQTDDASSTNTTTTKTKKIIKKKSEEAQEETKNEENVEVAKPKKTKKKDAGDSEVKRNSYCASFSLLPTPKKIHNIKFNQKDNWSY